MKKTLIVVLLSTIFLSGCNMQVVDLNYNFKYADIEGVGSIEISSWKDYENSDMMQVTGKDGTVSLTHSSK